MWYIKIALDYWFSVTEHEELIVEMAVEQAEFNYNIKLGNYNVWKSKLAWNEWRVYEIELNVFPIKFWFENHWHWETSKYILQSC